MVLGSAFDAAAGDRNRELPVLTGYTDRLSVAPGETIRFMVSTTEPEYDVQIVRLVHGDPHSRGPGYKAEVVELPVAGRHPGRRQELHPGSHILVPDSPALQPKSFTLQAWISPTTPDRGVQGIITKWDDRSGGYGLFVAEDGSVALWVGDGDRVDKVSTGTPLIAARWYFVAAVFDAERGRVSVLQEQVTPWPTGDSVAAVSRPTKLLAPGRNASPLLIGASAGPEGAVRHYNGKIDSPRVFALALALANDDLDTLRRDGSPLFAGVPLIAAWDFSKNMSTASVLDVSPNGLHGRTVNMPMRAATGHSWTGRETDFKNAPQEYGAIHFHDDELVDAAWEIGFELVVPSDMRSGIYAANIKAGSEEDSLPFFVRPPKGATRARVAFLIPTFNYQAYGNYATGIPGLLSLYDHHSDGSGVAYASHLTPLLDLRPSLAKERSVTREPFARHLSADLYLVDWMEAQGYEYDVITDHDLDLEGEELLAPYKVVISGSHPEYTSGRMLDGLESYLKGGGRFMYLGGNGFYWVTSRSTESPEVLEIRRWGGTRHWEAAPGERHHSTTGELGGLWRARGRAPQQLVGVGFTAQGWSAAGLCGLGRPYERKPGSLDPRAAFIFEGIGKNEIISGFPSLGVEGGAASDELDRTDHALGTPDHALVLATADHFSRDYQHVVEEVLVMDASKTEAGNPLVRSDMVYFEYPSGGAVFSVGSIGWLGSLSYDDYDNNVSKITGNVLRRFASDEPLPLPQP
jgi:N,N-dimethylformamidase